MRHSAQDSPQLTWGQWHPEKVQDLGEVSCGNLDTISVTSGFMTLEARAVEWPGNYGSLPFSKKVPVQQNSDLFQDFL